MDTYISKLDSISRKTQRLINEHTSSKEKCLHLLSENENLKAELESKNELIEELKERNRLLQISGQLAGGDDNAELKKKINAYIREIDKCIGLLNN